MLARALVTEPRILLMDEPTNHLDVASVEWLESFLRKLRVTMIFVTHDRQLIKSLANRIVEIDRGSLTSWNQTYEKYLQSREQAMAAQAEHDRQFDKKLKQEETWIRQGIKARRTRNEGRVRALKKLREERAKRRAQIGQVNIQVQTGDKSGKVVFELDGVSHRYDEKVILKDFSTTIMRGQKLAIIGPNGSGKTTLLKIILGELQPDSGGVKLGTNLQVAYFDQLRSQLNDKLSAADNVSEGADFVDIGSDRKHIMGYMQEFLFSPERARAPITALSGGERNRLLLAKLFTRPANVLVLDEPTNDLDVETLELLEYTVLNFTGTVLIVSHDREFIDNIANTTIAFETDGSVREYVGGYTDYLSQRPAQKSSTSTQKKSDTAKPKTSQTGKVKLSYKLQRELNELPAKIETLEAEKEVLETKLASPDIYQNGGSELTDLQAQYASLETAIATAYERWDELESISSQ
jgi:ATP-binding cassette subfamily F protein uup